MLIQKQTLEALYIRKKRVVLVSIGFACAFVLLFLRLFSLQVLQRSYYRRVAENNCILRLYQKASRGTIFDRHKNVLAGNTPTFVVTFTPYSLNQIQVEKVSGQLAKLLQCSVQDVQARTLSAVKSLEPVVVASHIPREKALTIMEEGSTLAGVNVEIETIRSYPQESLACHVIGYVGEMSLDEYKKKRGAGYKIGDKIGKTGIESVYDQFLRGEDGEKQIEVSATGRQLQLLRELPTKNGNDVELTLDAELQKVSEAALKGKNGAVVAVDPRTGEVLALASSPGFNLNWFLRPISPEEFNYLFKNKNKPLFNKAVQGQYPPGSVFKIITAAACLQEGYIVPEERLECSGKYELGNQKQIFHCWEKKGHGHVALLGALSKSCDVFFYQMGLRLGITRLAQYAKSFGLGAPTRIDLPSEKKGIVPDRAWKKKVVKDMWYDGDTLNMAIGQGYVWATPLQIANVLSMVANNGVLYRPTVMRAITSLEGENIKTFSPELIGEVEIENKNWDIIKRGLEETVEKGTGRQAFIPQLRVAGKTGTSQNPHGPDHAWFGCFAPVDNPEIVVVVFIEHGGHGGAVAAPIARRILATHFNKVPPSQEIIPAEMLGD